MATKDIKMSAIFALSLSIIVSTPFSHLHLSTFLRSTKIMIVHSPKILFVIWACFKQMIPVDLERKKRQHI